MRNRNLTLLTTIALLTAAASVGQPQTVDPSTGMTSTTPTTTEDRAVPGTTTSSSSATTSTSGTSGTTAPSSTAPTSGTLGTPASNSGTMDRSQSVTSSTAGSSQLQGEDANFLQRALEMGRLEVAHAQAALENAQRSDTKTAARMLLEDHQRSNQQLQQLASRKGWSLPSESAESDQARAAASAGGFDDDRFMAEQIRMHRDAISLFRAQSSSGADPELRQFARDQLPHLEHHLEMLQGQATQK